MPRRPAGAIAPASRKSLSEWITSDDGDTSGPVLPVCGRQARTLHARIVPDPPNHGNNRPEPLAPPQGLRLAPLG